MKDSLKMFAAALELESPWYVKEVEFKGTGKEKQLHIYLSHKDRVKFKYEEEECPVYDHQQRYWRHLNFFQHECYIHALVTAKK